MRCGGQRACKPFERSKLVYRIVAVLNSRKGNIFRLFGFGPLRAAGGQLRTAAAPLRVRPIMSSEYVMVAA